jgi:hypothetical protein
VEDEVIEASHFRFQGALIGISIAVMLNSGNRAWHQTKSSSLSGIVIGQWLT